LKEKEKGEKKLFRKALKDFVKSLGENEDE